LDILNKVKQGKVSFEKNLWLEVSDMAKDLILKLLTVPAKRLSATEAILHPWIMSLGSYPSPSKSLIDSLKANLKGFHNRNKLYNAITAFISNQVISTRDTKELRELFKSLDTNCDGKLSKEELVKGFNESNNDLISSIMFRVDTDKNGFIDLDEFLIAAFNQQTLLSKENMKKAFDMFDLDGNGTVSYEELQTVLGLGVSAGKTIWKEVMDLKIKQAGEDISFEEFCDLICEAEN
jgi:calcium-dependent protein kinase